MINFLLALLPAFVDDYPKLDTKTLSALKQKLAGRVTWDRGTNLIQIAYDFKSTKQGNDFLLNQTPMKVKNGLNLIATEEAIHVVPWRTVQVECQVPIPKGNGGLMKSEKSKVNYSIFKGERGGSALIGIPGQGAAVVIQKADLAGVKTIRLELAETFCLGTFGSSRIQKQDVRGPAGRISFLGGTHGSSFRSVVFRGRPEAEWLEGLAANKE